MGRNDTEVNQVDEFPGTKRSDKAKATKTENVRSPLGKLWKEM